MAAARDVTVRAAAGVRPWHLVPGVRCACGKQGGDDQGFSHFQMFSCPRNPEARVKLALRDAARKRRCEGSFDVELTGAPFIFTIWISWEIAVVQIFLDGHFHVIVLGLRRGLPNGIGRAFAICDGVDRRCYCNAGLAGRGPLFINVRAVVIAVCHFRSLGP
jgi:hypothetical protein